MPIHSELFASLLAFNSSTRPRRAITPFNSLTPVTPASLASPIFNSVKSKLENLSEYCTKVALSFFFVAIITYLCKR